MAKRLIVEITGQAGSFTSEMARVNSSLKAAGQAAQTLTAGWTSTFQNMSSLGTRLTVGVSLPVAAVSAAAVKADMDIQSLRLALESTTGSAAEAARQFERLKIAARAPGLGFEEAVRGSVALQAAGASAALAERSMKAFANAIALTGGGKEQLAAVNEQLKQMLGKGKVLQEDVKIIRSYVPQLSRAMQAAFGAVDPKALTEAGVTGKLFVEGIVAELEKLPPVASGVKNDFENLADASKRAAASFGEALRPATQTALQALEPLVVAAEDLGKRMGELPDTVKIGAAAIGGLAIAIPPVIAGAGQLGLALMGLQGGMLVLKGLTPQLAAVGTVLTTGVAAGASTATIAVAALGRAVLVAGTAFAAWELGRWTRDVTGLGEVLDRATDRVARWFGYTTQKLPEETAAMRDNEFARKKLIESLKRHGSTMDTAAASTSALIAEAQRLGVAMANTGDKVGGAAAGIERAKVEWMGLEETLRKLAQGEHLRKIEQDYFKLLDTARSATPVLSLPEIEQGAPDLRKINLPSTVIRPPEVSTAGSQVFTAEDQALMDELAMGAGVYAENMGKAAKTTQQAGTFSKELSRQVSLIFNDVGRNIVDLQRHGGKLKDVLKSIPAEMGYGFERLALEKIFDKLTEKATKLFDVVVAGLGKIPGIGSALDWLGMGGGAGSAATAAAKNAAPAATTPPAATSAVSSGLASTVSMITGAVSAVSGVIGNFQMAGMNKSLDLIEHETRYSQIHLLNILEKLNTYIPGIKDLHDYMWTFQKPAVEDIMFNVQRLVPAGAGGGGASVTIQGGSFIGFRDLDAFTDEIVRRLKQRGV